MIFSICFVLGDGATCAETDAYSELCYHQNQSAPMCHNGACISCIELNVNEPHWDAVQQKCDSCEELHYNAADNKCVESCPVSAPIAVNHVCKTCYEVSWLKPKWTGNKCDYCYDSYWDGEDCVATCPGDAPKTYAGVCYQCADSLYFNPQNRQCVSQCPDTLPTFNDDKVCVTCLEKDPSAPMWLVHSNGHGECYHCNIRRNYYGDFYNPDLPYY